MEGTRSVLQKSPLTKVEAHDLHTYTVEIVKGAGETLGMGVDIAGECLVITAVLHDGMVHNWNEQHRESGEQVQAGHLIVEVNGIAGSGVALRDECRDAKVLNMRIAKEAGADVKARQRAHHRQEKAAIAIQRSVRQMMRRRLFDDERSAAIAAMKAYDEEALAKLDVDRLSPEEQIGYWQDQVRRLREKLDHKDESMGQHLSLADEELEAKTERVDALEKELVSVRRQLGVAKAQAEQLAERLEEQKGRERTAEMTLAAEQFRHQQQTGLEERVREQQQELDALRERCKRLDKEVRAYQDSWRKAEEQLALKHQYLEKASLEQGALSFKLDAQAAQIIDQETQFGVLLQEKNRALTERGRELEELRAEIGSLRFNRSPRTVQSDLSESLCRQLADSLATGGEYFDASTVSPLSTSREGRGDPRYGKVSPTSSPPSGSPPSTYRQTTQVSMVEVSQVQEEVLELKERLAASQACCEELQARLEHWEDGGDKQLHSLRARVAEEAHRVAVVEEGLEQEKRRSMKKELVLKDKHERDLLNCRMAVAEAKRRITVAEERTFLAERKAYLATHPFVLVYDIRVPGGRVRRIVQIRLPAQPCDTEDADSRVSHLVVPLAGGGIKVHLVRGNRSDDNGRRMQLKAERWPDEDTLGSPPLPLEARPPPLPLPGRSLGEVFEITGMFAPMYLDPSRPAKFSEHAAAVVEKSYRLVEPFDSSTIDGLWEWRYCPPDGEWTLFKNWGVDQGLLVCELQLAEPTGALPLDSSAVAQAHRAEGRQPLTKDVLRAGSRRGASSRGARSASLGQRQRQLGQARTFAARDGVRGPSDAGPVVVPMPAKGGTAGQVHQGETILWSEAEGSTMSFSSKSPGRALTSSITSSGPGLPSVGDRVIASERLMLDRGAQLATVKFVGETAFAAGVWVGVALHNPVGKNDGRVDGMRYFDCQPECGLFLRPKMCMPLDVSILLDSMQEYLDHEGLSLPVIFPRFASMHAKPNSRLNALELSEIFEETGFALPLEAAHLVIAALDRDDDGELDLPELEAALEERRHGRTIRIEAGSSTDGTSAFLDLGGTGGGLAGAGGPAGRRRSSRASADLSMPPPTASNGAGTRKSIEWVDKRSTAS